MRVTDKRANLFAGVLSLWKQQRIRRGILHSVYTYNMQLLQNLAVKKHALQQLERLTGFPAFSKDIRTYIILHVKENGL